MEEHITILAQRYNVDEAAIRWCVWRTKKLLRDTVTETEIGECVLNYPGRDATALQERPLYSVRDELLLPFDMTNVIFSNMSPKDFIKACELDKKHAAECGKPSYWINYLQNKKLSRVKKLRDKWWISNNFIDADDYALVLNYILNHYPHILKDPIFRIFLKEKVKSIERWCILLVHAMSVNKKLFDILYDLFLEIYKDQKDILHTRKTRGKLSNFDKESDEYKKLVQQLKDIKSYEIMRREVLHLFIKSYTRKRYGYYTDALDENSDFVKEYIKLNAKLPDRGGLKLSQINLRIQLIEAFLEFIPFDYQMMQDAYKFEEGEGELMELIARNVKDIKEAVALINLYAEKLSHVAGWDTPEEIKQTKHYLETVLRKEIKNPELLEGLIAYRKQGLWDGYPVIHDKKSALEHRRAKQQ